MGAVVAAKKWSGIDGLRALCAMAVMLGHWGPEWRKTTVDTGGIGVGIFFAISGFLITNILLNSRDQLVTEGHFWRAMKIFYARRALRIFPVYYAFLIACAALVALGLVKIDGLPWHFAYLTNVYTVVRGWPQPIAAPFWSLAVEEQFYLLWPVVVFLTPKAALRYVILGAIALGVIFRLALTIAGLDPRSQTGLLLPACFDSLGVGALLAILTRSKDLDPRVVFWTGVAGVMSYAVIVACWMRFGERWPIVFAHLSIGLFAFAMLAAITSGRRSAKLAWLNWRPLQYLGMISYGLYLFHQGVAYGVDVLCHKTIHETLPMWPRLFVCAAADVAMASASWFWFEKPILSLKGRFSYRQAASRLEPAMVREAA
jgi:peptidoglycan/LPS O-acetylase OafA/YrhL